MNLEKKYNFVYITTNLINEKQYIGDHSTDDLENSRSKKYIGSGSIIKNAKKKYGKENFKRKILEFFSTKQEAFNAQEKYIKLYETHVSHGGYNLSWTGGTEANGSHSEESKIKMRGSARKRKASKETKEKMSISLMGHIVTKETRKKIGESTLGKKRSLETIEKIIASKQNISEETKRKISIATKLKMADPEIKRKMSEAHKGKVPWNKGKKFSKKIK